MTYFLEAIRLVGSGGQSPVTFPCSFDVSSGVTRSLLEGDGAETTSAPDIPDLLATSDSGTSDGDNITNAVQPVFRVGLPPEAVETDTVRVYRDGNSPIGDKSLDALDIGNGYADVTSATLSAGTYLITARIENAAGLSPASGGLSLTVDTTVPSVPTSVVVAPADQGDHSLQTTGTITATVAPASNVTWTILRKTKRTQAIDYTDNDPFPAESHERGLDRVTMIAQDSANAVDRALRFPITDLATLDPEIPNSMVRAGRYLAFDEDGLPIASTGPSGDSAIPVSSFIEGLLDDGDAETARATLGLSIGTDVAPAGISGDFVGRVAAYVGTTPPSGWLLLNGGTIGNLASGADHESAEYEELFVLLWNSMGVSEAAVEPAPRGASAALDWINAKTIELPDLRGRTVLGSGSGSGLSMRTHGGTGGAETHLLTANESGLPAHRHTYTRYQGGHVEGSNNGSPNTWFNVSTQNTGNNAPQDASQAHNNMQPFLALNFIVKY